MDYDTLRDIEAEGQRAIPRQASKLTPFYPTIPTPGGPHPANVYGRATALLSLMYREGLLPECRAYGKADSESDPDVLYINGEAAGKTDAEVTNFIWRMSDCWRNYGYLFE